MDVDASTNQSPTLGICSFSSGSKGSVNEVAYGSDNGAPDGIGLASQVRHQQADITRHHLRQPTSQQTQVVRHLVQLQRQLCKCLRPCKNNSHTGFADVGHAMSCSVVFYITRFMETGFD